MTATDWWIAAVGVAVGTFLDRWARRATYEQSLFYPLRRHCARCLQALPWVVGVPLAGIPWAGWRCRRCGAWIPWRAVFIQLLTAAAFVGLHRLHVGGRGEHLPDAAHIQNNFAGGRLEALVVYHALLYCFLLVACTVDYDLTLVPVNVTTLGSAVGIALGTFWFVELHPLPLWFAHASGAPRAAEWFSAPTWTALHRWWSGDARAELPAAWEAVRAWAWPWWNFHWNQVLGCATGVAGWLHGYLLIAAVDFVASTTLRREAMGKGDRDNLELIGAYLGWQSVALAFLWALVSGMVLGGPAALWRRGSHLPFGPHLAAGAALCVVWWRASFAALGEYLMTFQQYGLAAGALLAMLGAALAAWHALKSWIFAGREAA